MNMRQGRLGSVCGVIALSLTSAVLGGCATDPAPKPRCHGPWVVLPGRPDSSPPSDARAQSDSKAPSEHANAQDSAPPQVAP